MLISDKMSTAARGFDRGKTSADYAKYRDIYPPADFTKKAPRAVGAALAPDELADFGREHKALLERIALKRVRRAAPAVA